MRIVCASSVTLGREAFSTLGDVTIVPEREINAAVVRDADGLVTRSKVRINQSLLEGSRVAFVGTATAGTDHMDLDYLAAHDIAWCASPGCNANSVAEYLVAALVCLAQRHKMTLAGMTLAVVGVGHVGRRVVEKAGALGLKVLQNDPPLFAETNNPTFRPLDEILPKADLVTLHVPLHETGPYTTRDLAGPRFFQHVKPGCIFINTARGDVTDSASLLDALDRGAVGHAALDVFEDEPACRKELLERADLVSPHIAGYSYEGKLAGTLMVYHEACNFFEVEPTWSPSPSSVATAHDTARVDAKGRSDESVLNDVVRTSYDIEADDRGLRPAASEDAAARALRFERLRAEYPVRHEFQQTTVRLANASPSLVRKIRALGIQLTEP